MTLNKAQVESVLRQFIPKGLETNLFDLGLLKNTQVFGDEIVLDLEITNPTLQYKNTLEKECILFIKEEINPSVRVKINFSVKKQDDVKIKRPDSIPGVSNIIAVSSGKGGVGKSTVTANLAVALSDLGYKVGVVDADIYGPSMHIMFDLHGRKPETVSVDGKNKIKPLDSYGVKLLSIAFFVKSDQAVVWRGPMASKALQQLLWDTHWGDLDYLLVDLPPGTGDVHLSLVQLIPVTGALVVTTPQPVALADAKKGVDMFKMESINVPVLGILENMSYFSPEELPDNRYYIFGKEGAKRLCEEINVDLLGSIPLVQSVREASDIGRPAVLQGSTEIAIKFINFAKKVVSIIDQRNDTLPKSKIVEITNNDGCS